MTTNDAIKFFGGIKELAHELNIYPQAIYQWGKYPPLSRQYELHIKSKGKLQVGNKNDTKL